MRDEDQRYDEWRDAQFDPPQNETLTRRLAALGVESEPCGQDAVKLADGMVLSRTLTYCGPSYLLRIDPGRTITNHDVEKVLQAGGVL